MSTSKGLAIPYSHPYYRVCAAELDYVNRIFIKCIDSSAKDH